jgi:hypothetical protein
MGKLLFFPALCLLLMIILTASRNNDGVKVTITKYGTPCSVWGVVINGYTYAADDIPPAFRKEGTKVYAKYEFFEDKEHGACNGGIWARITSMKEVDE